MNMAAISNINLIEQPEQHILSIRTRIHFDDYPNAAKQAYEMIMEYAACSGLLLSVLYR